MLSGLAVISGRTMHCQGKLSVGSILFGLYVVCVAVAQATSPKPEPWLLQSEHITGDIHDGFKKTCLIVYPSGKFHRERRRQVSQDGRAQFEWEAPEVFKAQLALSDLNALRTILDAPSFSSMTGTVGDSRNLMAKVVFGPHGAVIPQENIDILTIAVSRSTAPQIFEIADANVARRQEPLRTFLNWTKDAERSQAQRLPPSEANNCSPAGAAGSTGMDEHSSKGINVPRVIYAPDPQPPHDTPKPQPVTVELLINPDGSVAQASLQSRASPDVAQSVLEVVRKWRFQPARLLGVPVAMKLHLRIEFQSK